MPPERAAVLEQRLVLLAWLNRQFGYPRNRDLLADNRETDEGFDTEGRSFVYHRLMSRGDALSISPDALARYDDNIRRHLRAMNARRSEPITLRYFQYLAALYTEVFLDGYFNHRGEMLRSLNDCVAEYDAVEPFAEPDLRKLAFWMATGSGKTLIMHLNYRQFLHYNSQPLDNVLLITPPSEGLSAQHLDEMAASGIPCRRFYLGDSGLMSGVEAAVQVIEISKLVEQKRGGGVRVPLDAFEGNNLIFVDEGHKGSGGEAWRRFRDTLGERGFTFEYSATFGQALTAARNDELTAEYGKAILFDYSYRYFHGDGYGKDFRVLNLLKETTEEATERLLLGNLLSFYEQQCVFEERAEGLRPYHLERPLWVFVGSTVVYSRDRQRRSDVLTVARFLHRVLENRDDWVLSAIEGLVKGESGLIAADDQDVFAGKFTYLRDMDRPAAEVYKGILERVFHAPAGGGLRLCAIRGADGELGLKASSAQDYFGLIYIGDTGAFKKLAEADASGLILEEDALSGSLFDGINDPAGRIEVLIGAKKFMEGWNSWRVSNMGLLNIGRSEGSEIIQLFGRGVRLRGKGASLKRSAALDGSHPEHIGLLETLNIFAVRANYMTQFRQYLEREGVETEAYRELPLAIRPNEDWLQQGLVVPQVADERDFLAEEDILLEPDRDVAVRVDMSLKVQALESDPAGLAGAKARSGAEQSIPSKSLHLIDWEQAYLDLLEYKEQRGLDNLIVQPDAPLRIVKTDGCYRLIVEETVIHPTSVAERVRLQEAVTCILRKYADAFYRVHRERWESERMVYKPLDERDPNLSFSREPDAKGQYVVSVRQSEHQLIGEIERLIDEGEQPYEKETEELPRLHFDRHLYQPLLVEKSDKVKSAPPALNQSEQRFVTDLKAHWQAERDRSLAGVELFLLRNLSRGVGVGFFETRGFYPDFILWIKKEEKQHIVFVEPHGMVHAEAYQHDDRARLHERLAKLTRELGNENVTLDSYIVSATRYDDLRRRYDDGSWDMERFAGAHILFAEDSYIERIFRGACRPRLHFPEDRVAEFCRRHHILRLALFGSVLRDDFTHESDVDVLVEFAPGKTLGLAFITIQDELSEIFGHRVDLHTFSEIEGSRNWLLREEILKTAEIRYEQA